MTAHTGTTSTGIEFRVSSYRGERNPNTRLVTYDTPDGPLDVYFSYNTVIAFRDPLTGGKLVACENVWTVTTGKHITQAGSYDKRTRLQWREFKDEVEKLDNRYHLPLRLQGWRY